MSKNKSDITARIITFIIAIFLWSFVMSEENPPWTREYKNVQVELINTSTLDRQGLVIMTPQEVTVNVEVSGLKSNMDRFSSSNIKAQVDLSGYNEGQVRIPVIANIQGQVSGITISNVEPKEILFNLDRIVTKEMNVTINTTGSLPEDYVIGDIVSTNQSVIVKGPRTWINEVDKVLALVDLTNRTTSEKVKVATTIVDDEGNEVRGLEKEPSVVDISIPVFRTISLPIELITTNELPENYSITNINMIPSNITVKGRGNVVNLTKIETLPVDINTMLDKTAVIAELNLPSGVELLNPNEKVTIAYNIEETISKELVFALGDINILNLDKNLDISEQDLATTFVVKLKGFKSILDNIENEDLEISIDLKDLVEGTNTTNILIEEIEGVTIEAISPQIISINLINR